MCVRWPSYTGGTIDHHVAFWKYMWDICVRHQMRDRFRNSTNESQWALNCIQNVWTQHQTGLWFCISCSCYILAGLEWFIHIYPRFAIFQSGAGFREGWLDHQPFVSCHFRFSGMALLTSGNHGHMTRYLCAPTPFGGAAKLSEINSHYNVWKYGIMITVKVRCIIALEIIWQES